MARDIPQCVCRAGAGLGLLGVLFFIRILRYAERRHVRRRGSMEVWRNNLVPESLKDRVERVRALTAKSVPFLSQVPQVSLREGHESGMTYLCRIL